MSRYRETLPHVENHPMQRGKVTILPNAARLNAITGAISLIAGHPLRSSERLLEVTEIFGNLHALTHDHSGVDQSDKVVAATAKTGDVTCWLEDRIRDARATLAWVTGSAVSALIPGFPDRAAADRLAAMLADTAEATGAAIVVQHPDDEESPATNERVPSHHITEYAQHEVNTQQAEINVAMRSNIVGGDPGTAGA